MDKVLSARVDESVVSKIAVLARELHTTKKRIIEGAIALFAEKVEADHKVDVVIVGDYAGGNVLQQYRLACLRRRHNETPLAPSDRRNEIDQSSREIAWGRLQVDELVREDRRLTVKQGPALG